jgi:DNA-binding IclR family transcriptional regulator
MTLARAVKALDALAHDTRLRGFIARKLGMPASSLSFHLMHLQAAGLVTQRREGRSLIYAVNFTCMDGLMAYLQENCCRGFGEEACATDLEGNDSEPMRRMGT